MPLHQDINRSSGFSLVEIMVGMVISLFSMVIILQVFTVFEGQKRTTTSGSDAQTNGTVALYTIERDVRMAGYGFSIPEAMGCTINGSFNGATLTAPLLLVPVTITNGAGGLPDRIRILSSSKGSWSIPARIITDHPVTAANFFLNTTLGMAVNDLLIAYEPGKDCTMLQVTGIPGGNMQILHQNTSPWNPPGLQNIPYSAGAMLFNLGSLMDHTYSLDANSNLVFSKYDSSTNTRMDQSLLPDIVNLQAEYGFDTIDQPDGRVDRWSDTMIDADNKGTVGDSGDISRIYAVRITVVARSALKEKADASGTCNITTTISANRPMWSGGAIDVSRNPDGSPNADWQCYRYKTFETVIPLRNMIWRSS